MSRSSETTGIPRIVELDDDAEELQHQSPIPHVEEQPIVNENDPGQPIVLPDRPPVENFTPLATERANTPLNEPESSPLDEELAEIRRWFEETQKREELIRLREIKARYLQGDTLAIQGLGSTTKTAVAPASASSSGLPRPEPPQVYAKRSRAEFNRWERDCESYFDRVPGYFLEERRKVDFGTMYIIEPLKTLWKAYCSTEQEHLPIWKPTWLALKTLMLNALGTEGERKQQAIETLKRVQQKPNQTPTELLDYLRPQWEELGDSYTLEFRVHDYNAALSKEIQDDLALLPWERRKTLLQVEEMANIIYRRRHHSREQRDAKTQNRTTQKRKGSAEPEGNTKPPKKAKKATSGHSAPKSTPKADAKATKPTVTCWGCGEVGHKRPDCPKAEKPSKDSYQAKSGKEKGQKT